MKKIWFLACVMCLGSMLAVNAYAQDSPSRPGGERELQAPHQPSTFEQVQEIREAIGLEQKEFDKVYSAYAKFNKKLFGDESGAQAKPESMRGDMRRGGGPGRPGGPQGGMGPGGRGPGGPGGMPPGEMNGRDRQPQKKPVDLEKLEKEKTKQEQKLEKSMQKIFKNSPGKYDQWLKIRYTQLRRIFPEPKRK